MEAAGEVAGPSGKVPKPLHCKTAYDFCSGTLVEITLKSGSVYGGKAIANPSATRNKTAVELINVRNVKTGRMITDSMLFTEGEIDFVRIVKTVDSEVRKSVMEFNLPTFLVDSKESLAAFLNNLSKHSVKEIAVAFHGVTGGRHGKVSWILFCVEKCLIPVNVDAFEKLNIPLWTILHENLFRDKTILKVCHNLKPAVDYLFHKHNMSMTSVYCTQLMDYTLEVRNCKDAEGEVVGAVRMVPLYVALKKYLERICPDTDIAWLEWYFKYEKFNNVKNNPLLERPVLGKYCKYMALTVKYLLPLKKELEWRKEKNFRAIFENYKNFVIEADIAAFSADDDDIMQGLPDLLSKCFRGEKKEEDENGPKNESGKPGPGNGK